MIKDTLIRYRKVDCTTTAYLLLSIILITLFRNNIDNFHIFLLLNASLTVLIFFLIFWDEKSPVPFISLIRDWYPIILFTFLFEETGWINRTIFPDYIDKFFIELEFRLFGLHPAIELGRLFDNILVMEYFHFAYFTYYLIIPGLGFILYFNNRKHFEEYVFVASFTFYACLVSYIFLPVLGARYYANAPFFAEPFWKEGILFVPIMRFIYAVGEVDGAAFPSSHVAIALVILIYAYIYARKYFWLFFITIISLIISTVYCRFHYLVDVMAGAVWALGGFWAGRKLYFKGRFGCNSKVLISGKD